MVGKEKDEPTTCSFAHRQMSFTAALTKRKECQIKEDSMKLTKSDGDPPLPTTLRQQSRQDC
jgi:hypothetical protein